VAGEGAAILTQRGIIGKVVVLAIITTATIQLLIGKQIHIECSTAVAGETTNGTAAETAAVEIIKDRRPVSLLLMMVPDAGRQLHACD
jgi:hypothetical protein